MGLFQRRDLEADFLARHAGARTLDVGCGTRKAPGAVGLDQISFPGVDVVHDLDVAPWPFPDASFDAVVARHVVEHLEDIPAAMAEIRRVLRPRGEALVATPHFSDANSYVDPTHKYHLAAESFVTFCREPTPWFDLVDIYVEISGRWRNLGYEARVNRPSGVPNALSREMLRWESKHCFTRRGGQLLAILRLRP